MLHLVRLHPAITTQIQLDPTGELIVIHIAVVVGVGIGSGRVPQLDQVRIGTQHIIGRGQGLTIRMTLLRSVILQDKEAIADNTLLHRLIVRILRIHRGVPLKGIFIGLLRRAVHVVATLRRLGRLRRHHIHDQFANVVVVEINQDILMILHEHPDVAGLRLRERVALAIHLGEVEGEVTVRVDTTQVILGHLAIPIVVITLITDTAEAGSFPPVCFVDANEAHAIFAQSILTFGILRIHHAKLAIAIHIFGHVVIVETILVIIQRTERLTGIVLRVRIAHIGVVGIHIQARQDIDRRTVQRLIHPLIVIIACQKIPSQIEGAGDTVHLVAMNRTIHPNGRFLRVLTRVLGCDGQDILITSHTALADRLDGAEVGVFLLQILHDLCPLVVVVVALPVDHKIGLAMRCAHIRLFLALRPSTAEAE